MVTMGRSWTRLSKVELQPDQLILSRETSPLSAHRDELVPHRDEVRNKQWSSAFKPECLECSIEALAEKSSVICAPL